MATPPEAVRTQLAVVTAATSAELASVAAQTPPERQVAAALAALPLIVPSYYDAAGSLALAWYDERRDESRPTSTFAAEIVGTPETDWIERELESFRESFERDLAAEARRFEDEAQALMDEMTRLVEKEVARGFRATVIGNSHADEDAVGWSRVTRPGACKLCVMLADKGAVYREETANFAAHTDCHCAARPEFLNGDHGPEATVEQYLASAKRRTPAQRAQLRAYLNQHYPDHSG